MRSYVRESIKLGNGRTLITHYTPSEYLWISVIKFLFFLILWPVEITFWLFFYSIKYGCILLWLIVKWTFIGLGKGLSALFRWIFHRR